MTTADVLTVEIGSTITKVNAFSLGDGVFTHAAQGFAPTSVQAGDVGLGVDAALTQVGRALGVDPASMETFVNSSAAGGLRMTVHGLTASMTARAAREASLGAGAIVTQLTAGPLESYDLQDVREIARKGIEKVKESGEAFECQPMNSFERKVVHDEVAKAGLYSESAGEGDRRRVVIQTP